MQILKRGTTMVLTTGWKLRPVRSRDGDKAAAGRG
jgi:hypothetical protein